MNKNKIANSKINCIFCDTKHTFKVCSGLCNTELKKYSDEEVEIIIQKLMDDIHCGDLCYGNNVIDFKLSPRQWFNKFKNK